MAIFPDSIYLTIKSNGNATSAVNIQYNFIDPNDTFGIDESNSGPQDVPYELSLAETVENEERASL